MRFLVREQEKVGDVCRQSDRECNRHVTVYRRVDSNVTGVNRMKRGLVLGKQHTYRSYT